MLFAPLVGSILGLPAMARGGKKQAAKSKSRTGNGAASAVGRSYLPVNGSLPVGVREVDTNGKDRLEVLENLLAKAPEEIPPELRTRDLSLIGWGVCLGLEGICNSVPLAHDCCL